MKNKIIALIAIFSTIVFIESCIPFIIAEKKCKEGDVFLGQVTSTFDQNMYFSFIRQAKNGKFLFNNRLTYLPNRNVFINLEFWLLGATQRITGLTENSIYTIWRYFSTVVLTAGFIFLASLLLSGLQRIVIAAFLFLFTGGLGFIVALIHYLSTGRLRAGTMINLERKSDPGRALDITTHLFPFKQIMVLPHVALPTGLLLLGYYFYLYAEKTEKWRFYIFSGMMMLLIGLIRPYDIIPIFIIIPIYLLVTGQLKNININYNAIIVKLIPLLIIIPVLVYNVWLFRYNEIFKFWSSQGNTSGKIPSFIFQYLSFGIIGILAIVRLIVIKSKPLSRNEKFLIVLFSVSLLLSRCGIYFSFMRWSNQIGGYMAAPLILLGCKIVYSWLRLSKRSFGICIVSIIAITCISNFTLLYWHSKVFDDKEIYSLMYASKYEIESWQWLQKNAGSNQVVLSSTFTSSRIAKYTDLSVVVGHPFVSPDYINTTNICKSIAYDSLGRQVLIAAINKLKIDYIYIGPMEKDWNKNNLKNTELLSLVYENPVVNIYKVK